MAGKTGWGPIQQNAIVQQQNNISPAQAKVALAQGGVMAPVSPIFLDKNLALVQNPQITDPVTGDAQARTLKQTIIDKTLGAQTNPYQTNQGYNSFDDKLAALGVNFDPMENPLNIYASYSYHIRFFMTAEGTAYAVDPNRPNTDNMAKTVIAESGVTAGFNIRSLRIESSAGADRKKRNMWYASDWKMEITESMGLTLLDRMYNAAKNLGVRNYVRAPYFVEIWFQGYDEDGNIVSKAELRTLYRVVITDIQANADEVGAVYTLTMTDDGGMGEMNQISIPPSQLQITATTLGEFYKNLETQWNESAKNINGDKFARTEIKINYPPVFNNWTLKNAAVSEQNARNTDMKAVPDGPNMVISIAKGQSIENIVNWITYLSGEAVKWINGTGSVSQSGATLREQGMVRYVSVFPKAEIIAWDDRFKDYVRRVTYNLVPTESVRSYTDMTSIAQLSSPNVSRNKLQYMIDNQRLTKRYDYLYTGKNTEIIGFDMHLDNYWAVAQPIWDQMTDYSQWTLGGLASLGSVAFQKAKGTYTRDSITPGQLVSGMAGATQTAGSAQGAGMSFNGSQSLVDEATARTAMQQAQATQQTTANQPNNGATTSSTRSTTSDTLANNLSPGSAALSGIVAKNPEITLAQPQEQPLYTARQSQMATTYLEDYSSVLGASYSPALPVAGIFDTMPYFQNAIQTADQNKVLKLSNDPTSYGPGTGYVATILSNIFDDNFLLNIDLQIRGDPWWMPISNIQQNEIAQVQATSNGAAATGAQDQANLIGGDNEIVFELRLGVEINEDTGLADLSQSTFFNGVYQVLNIMNEFANGKFTQVLTCQKDVLEQVGSQTQNVSGATAAGGNQTMPNPTNNTGAPTPTYGGPR